MKRVLLINASRDEYNLGLNKAANWWAEQGEGTTVHNAWDVPSLFSGEFDVVWISAIFSWDVPILISMAQTALKLGKEVAIGGPGTFGVRDYIRAKTSGIAHWDERYWQGLWAQSTPDSRFERQPGSYKAVFWSRGCPAKNCSLGFPKDGAVPICSVPQMEGWKFTLYDDVTPAPIIMDNNLSALPRTHQELIVERTLAAGFPEVDANSGFEPRSFRPWTAELWRHLPLKAWRFAYDELAERPAVMQMMNILDEAGISRKKRHIYCLAGNEPISDCLRRVDEIVKWKCMPIVQRRRPLNWMVGTLPTLFDWTEQSLIDFQRWGSRLSAGIPFSDYKRGTKDRPINPSFL